MLACHAGGPGSIPGRCIVVLFLPKIPQHFALISLNSFNNNRLFSEMATLRALVALLASHKKEMKNVTNCLVKGFRLMVTPIKENQNKTTLLKTKLIKCMKLSLAPKIESFTSIHIKRVWEITSIHQLRISKFKIAYCRKLVSTQDWTEDLQRVRPTW